MRRFGAAAWMASAAWMPAEVLSHLDVHQDHVALDAFRQLHDARAGGRLTHHLHVRLGIEQLGQVLPQQVKVVGNENGDHVSSRPPWFFCRPGTYRGSITMKVLPLPSALFICMWPRWLFTIWRT